MKNKISYSKVLLVNAKPTLVFKAITVEIDKWWTVYSNKTKKTGDKLSVKFGENTFKTMKLTKVILNQVIHWKVEQANIDIKGLSRKNEWVGTTIKWEIEKNKNGSKINFTHQGLIPEFECYNACEGGWDYFLNSLADFLNKGKGTPHFIKNNN
ncbi:MAG: SRPBCC domain-containing protein [Saprospiraceae bacterium]